MLAWKGIVAVDYLQKLLWRVRPYEQNKGESDRLFNIHLKNISTCVRNKGELGPVLRQATHEFRDIINTTLPRRPLVGINGEIYLRSNVFSNRDLTRTCEQAGLEVVVSPVGEWLKYTSHRNLEDSLKDRKLLKILKSYLRKQIQEIDEHTVARHFQAVITEKEPSTIEILRKSAEYLSSRCGSEAVLSIGSGIDWLEKHEFAGVISVMPHGCMPGGIVAAMSERFSDLYQKPWISLTYDGFLETNNTTKINEFAELVRFCSKNNTQKSAV
jgi:predicted nucleotide-binding protein (sugar kinase/HSP70/actin superfamily)